MRSIAGDDAAAQVPEASLLGLLNVLLRRRWLVLLPAAAIVAIAIVTTYLKPRTYTSTAAFVPHVRQSSGSLQGLASQLGIGLAQGDPMQSPQFYVELAESREILSTVADTRYSFTTDTGVVSGTLGDVLQPPGRTAGERRETLLRQLERLIDAGQSQQTGIVRISVTTPHAELSQRIVENIIALVNDFNLQTRQSQVRAEREFLEQRLGEAQGELRAAEDRLQGFLARNRNFGLSSALTVERERLQRDVATYRAIYTDLAQNFERARMEEVRDTPVITVLERPEVPVVPDRRGLLRNALLALVAGLTLGVVLAFVREYLLRLRNDEATDYEQFVRLRHESLRDVTHPWQAVARLVRRRGSEG